MDKGLKKKLREKLIAERKIFSECHTRAVGNANESDPRQIIGDRFELSAAVASHGFHRNLASGHREQLVKIEAAIARIDSGDETYGICLDCDDEIPVKRMEAAPWARRCISCEERRGAEVASVVRHPYQASAS